MKLTRSQVQELSKDLNAAIAPVLAKHGLQLLSIYNRYSDTEVKCSISLGSAEAVANIDTVLDKLFPDGRTFKIGNYSYDITGYNRKARKNCIILTRHDGKKCHTTVEYAQYATKQYATA